MRGWRRQGDRVVAGLKRQEAELLRALVGQVKEILLTRAAQTPQDELSALTGIRTGASTTPEDPILSRLLPDFHRLDIADSSPTDRNSAAALRSLHEPELLDTKTEAASMILDTCPPRGGTIRLDETQSELWLSALNDVRLALGVSLNVTEDVLERPAAGDPRAQQLNVYQWLTWMQDSLVQAIAG